MTKKVTKLVIIIYILIELLSFVDYTLFTYFNEINGIFTFFVFALVFFININEYDKKTIVLIGLITIVSMVSMLFSGGTIGSLIHIFNIMLGITVFSYIKFDKVETKLIFILELALLILFYTRCEDAFYLTQYFKGTSFNSNTIALIIMCFTLTLSVLLERKNKNKLLIIILNIISIVFILQSQSRGAAIGVVVFLLLFIMKKYINKKVFFTLLAILIIVGTVFPIGYVYMYENGINFQLPFTNKSLYTGREHLWSSAIRGFQQESLSIIFGLGSDFKIEGMDELNMHNMYWGICVNFGVIAFVLIMTLFNRILKTRAEIKYALPIFSLFINGYFETVILWPATTILICILMNVISIKEEN